MRSLVMWRDKSNVPAKSEDYFVGLQGEMDRPASRWPQAHTKSGLERSTRFIGAVALALIASLWSVGLATPAHAALHPAITLTPAEVRRKPHDIAAPYIVEWVVPAWSQSKLDA